MSAALFAEAFLAAQKEFPTIAKTKTAKIPTKAGGEYSYKYADLGDVLAVALPILHKHGIALSQPPASEAGRVGVATRLIHVSGHVEDSGVLLLAAGDNAQAAGSAMTYARRYAACAALGIVADEDDDGAAASVPQRQSDNRAPVVSPQVSSSADHACPHCGSKVYDNRAENYGTIKPLWKCSNKSCGGGKKGYGWASWDDEPFLDEKPVRQDFDEVPLEAYAPGHEPF